MSLRLRRETPPARTLRLAVVAAAEEDDTQQEDNDRYASELCPTCRASLKAGEECTACAATTAAFGTFDEAKHPRVHAGEKGGGRFTVKENAAGRFEVVNPEGTKVAETTDAADAETLKDEKNVDDAMISRRVDGGYNEQQSRELLDELRRTTSPENLPMALAYNGFITEAQAELPGQMTLDGGEVVYPPAPTTPPGQSAEYAQALAKSSEASKRYDAALQAYRAKEIGDEEYLAARRLNDAARTEFDEAMDRESARPLALEGPFTYPSGWTGRYDPSEGKYLGLDDIYMPADFDPSRDAGSAMVQADPSRVERVRRISGLANAGARGETRADGPSHMDYSPEDLRQTLRDSTTLTPEARANIERTLGFYDEDGRLKAAVEPEEPCQECIDIVASIPVKPPPEWFADPELDGPTPITVTSDGQISGHAAIWGTCHLGNPRGPGHCVEPPRSRTGYELFHLGEVETDTGLRVAVGNVTLDTGHAPLGAGARTAAAHYDDTGTVIADVVAGEDEHGLWFAGALRSDVTPETVRKFTGSKISGDWRGGELVGMLCVNVPGFPVPRARARLVADASGGEEVLALVAAGIVGEQPTPAAEIEIRVAMLCARAEGIDALTELALA